MPFTLALTVTRAPSLPAGYHYDLPFLQGVTSLEGQPLVTVEDNRVGPLYQHVFPPAAAPTLSFIGL